MQTVWLTCPKCSQSFEIDVGFSGAVCRCLQCGALVSVPNNQSPEQSRASRPQTPKGARFVPQLGDAQTEPENPAVSNEPDELLEATLAQPVDLQTPQTNPPQTFDTQPPATQEGYPQQPPTEQPPTVEDQFNTPPGYEQAPANDQWDYQQAPVQPSVEQNWPPQEQTIPPDTQAHAEPEPWIEPEPQQMQVPSTPAAPARPNRSSARSRVKTRSKHKSKKGKSRGIKTGIIGGFILIVALMIIVVVFALKHSVSTTEPASAAENETPDTTTITTTNADGSTSVESVPREASILSIPTTAKTVIVIDAGSSSGPWLPMIKSKLTNDLILQPSDISVQVVLASEDGPSKFPEEFSNSEGIDRAACDRFMRSIMALGSPDLIATIQSACEAKPTQIILITGREVSVEQIRAISQSTSAISGLRFDVMAIGAQTSRLASFARRNQGKYQQFSLDEFQAWYESQP